jgi:hypothetical protein
MTNTHHAIRTQHVTFHLQNDYVTLQRNGVKLHARVTA